MDSLLANYASSDEEQDEKHERSEKIESPSQLASEISVGKTSPFISSLPPPKSSSSLFSFLPPPKSHHPNPSSLTQPNLSSFNPISQRQKDEDEDQPESQPKEVPKAPPSSASSIFSSLPPPKSLNSDPFALTNLPSTPNPQPKRVIQVKLPVNPSRMKSRDSDDDDDDDKEREGKKSATGSFTQTASVKSFLSSIPAPKNSSRLGSLPSAAGSGRRSIIEADVTTSFNSNSFSRISEVGVSANTQSVDASSSASLEDVGNSAQYVVDSGGGASSDATNENYEHYAGYGNYDYHGQYESNWGDGSTTMVQSDIGRTGESVMKLPGKRGRNEIPQEFIEVNQDELIKNRPREDQVRSTGIAFGPSYQPVSTKGKPTKLHKRKHQIGSLYFDMRQKEMELAERRSKGFLTKAETQAKYGW